MKKHRARHLRVPLVCVGICAGTALCALSPSASQAQSSPAAAAESTKLYGVSAASTTDAWAVGFRQDAPGGSTLALTRHWDGSKWRVVRSEHPGEDSFLWGTVDIGAGDAWAVGESLGGATMLPLAEHWDGTSWTAVSVTGTGLGRLNAVDGRDSDDVWLVGEGVTGSRAIPRAFIAHWDGSRIHGVKPARLTQGKYGALTSVALIAGDDVWAVGEHGRAGQTNRPLIEHWDGTAWTSVPSDARGGSTANLAGVDGTSSSDSWAVGWHVARGTQTIAAFAEHWDGRSWTMSDIPAPGYASSLTGVSAISADDVWAVGSWARSKQPQRTLPLIEHWDGSSWSIVDAPAGDGHQSISIRAVSFDQPADGFAVGETDRSMGARQYTIQWDGHSWSR